MALESLKSNKITVSKDFSTDKKTIHALVVDDDTFLQKIHMMLLRKLGLETEAVGNGKEAVDLCLSRKRFNIILMDMEIPIMDGLEATKELRKIGVNCMIVAVTSRSLEAEKQAFIGAGVDDCLNKPITIDAVNCMLDELVKNSRTLGK